MFFDHEVGMYMDKVKMGSKIKVRRLELGYTQEQLAEKTNLSLRSITDIERGKVGMSLDTIVRITSKLYMTPNDLLLSDASEKVRYDDDKTQWLMELFAACSHKQKDAIIEIIKAYLGTL